MAELHEGVGAQQLLLVARVPREEGGKQPEDAAEHRVAARVCAAAERQQREQHIEEASDRILGGEVLAGDPTPNPSPNPNPNPNRNRNRNP